MIAPLAILTVSAAIAGSPVQVTCDTRPVFDSIAESYGYDADYVAALGAPNRIWLRQHDCITLNRIARGKEIRPWRAADAILTLGHELYHARGRDGWKDERAANRYGANISKRIAKLLGHRKPFRVRQMAWLYARNSEEGV